MVCFVCSEEQGLVDIKTADWSEEVAPFWGAVIKTALTGQGLAGLFKAGWTTIKVRLHLPRHMTHEGTTN